MLTLDWNIIWDIVNIIILFLLLRKFLFKPVTEMMEKRTKTIEDSLDNAKKTNEEAEKIKAEYEDSLKNARQEATAIIDKARKQAKQEEEITIMEASKKADKIISDSKKAIEAEKEKSMSSMQDEIAMIALAAATKVMERSMDDDTNKKYVDEFIKEAGAAK